MAREYRVTCPGCGAKLYTTWGWAVSCPTCRAIADLDGGLLWLGDDDGVHHLLRDHLDELTTTRPMED